MVHEVSGPVIVLDANVLFPASLRDLLLRCAEHDLYRLRISEQIWEEVTRNLGASRRLTGEQLQRLDNAILAFLRRNDALVMGYEPLIPSLINHPKDRHVLAVAIHAHAQIILTFNLKDFPDRSLKPHGIGAEHPDAFLARLYDREPALMWQIVNEQAAALVRPPLSVVDVLNALALHVPTFVARFRAEQHAQDDPATPT